MQDLKNLNYLLPNTKKLLLSLINNCEFLNKFVLVGGSALTLYLHHRKSEDLDFFTYENLFDKKEILDYIKVFKQSEILNQTNEQIDLLLDGVKITFFNAKWNFLKPLSPQRLNIAPLESIAAMKVNLLFLRAKYRDYYDLYYLVKNGMGLKELFEVSKKIVPGITFKLLATALIYIDDIEEDNINHLEPIEQITKQEIRNYFQEKLNNIV
jgi:predicted nucleotidyltransferase component of viral defense system